MLFTGCRNALLNVEARPLQATGLSRKCVVARLADVTPGLFSQLLQQGAAGLLAILPQDLDNLSPEEHKPFPPINSIFIQYQDLNLAGKISQIIHVVQTMIIMRILQIEGYLLEEEVPIPVYLATSSPEVEEVYRSIQELPASSSAAHERCPLEGVFSRGGSTVPSLVCVADLVRSVVASGYQLVVSSGQPSAMSDLQIPNIQGKLTGFGIEENLPTLAIVAHYDAFGLAPLVSYGADSNGSGVVALLELARLLSQLYTSSRTHPSKVCGDNIRKKHIASKIICYKYHEYIKSRGQQFTPAVWSRVNVLFLLSGGGKFNFQGAKKWIEDNLDIAESSLLADSVYTLCLDSLGAGDNLYLHVSKPPREGSPGHVFFQELQAAGSRHNVSVNMVHKKINLADESRVWEHERFSMRRLPAFTLSHLASHRAQSRRSSILDTSGSYLPCQRQRDPSTFSGDGNINPGQWLKEYERVSKYNRWDETMKLANVVFYLNGTAGRWFDNNEESLNSWRSFEDAFRGVFGLQEDSARRAEEVLKSRAQKAEESSESYIQEILSLCHQVNPRMEEGEIVAHIIKGISEDTYQVLVAKDIQTVDEILKFCRHLTTVKQRRIGRTKFARLSNVMPISCVDDSDDLAGLIRRIVREEIQKVFSAPEVINPLREVNALEQTVREEVSRALQPTRPQVNVVQQQPRTPYYNIDRPTQPRKTEHWRTYDDKPICFHCGRPGHVVRYCRERRQVFAEARSRNGGEGRNVGFSSRPPRYDADDDYVTPQTSTPSFQPFSHASECEKLSGAASNGGEVAIEENPPGYIAAKLKENFVMVEINGRKIKALVDSGADFSVISDKFRRELKTPLFKEPGPILKAANKNLIETLGKCVLNIEVNGLKISFEFVVMVECSHDIIFGWDFFKATEAVIDCGRNELHLGETSALESREEENQRLFASDDFVIPPKSIKKISVINEEVCGVRDVLVSTSKDLLLRKEVLIPNSLVTFRHGRGSIWVANGASWPQLIPSGMNMCTMESYENGNICSLIESSDKLQETQLKSREWSQKINLTLDPGLSEIQRLQLVSCLDEFIDIFDFGSTPIKPTSTVKHKINTGDHSPIKQRPYRVAPSERRLIQDEVNKMIENHIVKPSESPWSSPVILVRKKDGTWRFCVDYRRLNKITKKDVYPLPRIDDALDSLASSSYFSTMDLRSGYWQIEVDEKDREKTAFITPDGLYEFQIMPFGLCNAPATFERMIDSVLGSLKWNMCLCYLDDIVVYAPTFEEHLRRLQLVLSCIQKAGLSLNHKKCLFGSRRIKILGHLVDANGIHPDPDKVEAVSKFPRPRNISELKSFLGLCSYYRRFIENFADKARSLHDLLKTEKQFYWDAAQEKAFEVLKTALISEPVLGHFDESADTHLHTDASGHGIGAVLLQIQGGKEWPIAYASRSLTKAENNYSTTEKECLAVVWSISKFRPYLFGRPFTVVTDHHSLCWLVGQKDPSGRLARWALKLQEFDVTVIYKSGRKHKDADCLSRSPLENDQPSAVMSLTNVDIEQTKDPDLAKIIDNLNSGYTRKEFSIIDGILYKKNYSTTGRPWLMMIPKHLRSEVMADLHDAPTAGHLGFARTYDKVKKRFYWPGLYRTVRQYVSHCRECQRRKKLPRRPAGQLVSIPPVEKPFYKVGVDLLGKFPVSKDGNRWIIVCTDYMTRFTTAYHPQTNGLTERFNKTLGDMLSMYTGVEQKDWDQVLPYVTFAYNTAKQEATGYTPFFLVHAREAETYIDAVLPYLPDEISNDYVGELVTRAEEARQLSRSRLLQSQAKDRRLYDQKHTVVYYQKDDLVWVFTPIRKVGLSEKLLKRYFGPYKVTKKLSEVTVDQEVLQRNIQVVGEALARHMYNLTEEPAAVDLLSGSLAIQKESVEGWAQLLSSLPRPAQTLNLKHPLVVSLHDALARYLKDVRLVPNNVDKREPEVVFYQPLQAPMNAYKVKPAVFDLVLALAIAAYLGVIYLLVTNFYRLEGLMRQTLASPAKAKMF
ncbi:hypothetical protein LAZ67_14002906 [Cordylochernes scorpioides]|uniref:RNA-directed DNA polymerase n=1 Tax=Cordylochernes scorpioides TaxID=51811 RepID=A0ABY6L785_9ARAC|nr:hypothetical protein LAZ67_14002906 [Cordylochernes scorpioides]